MIATIFRGFDYSDYGGAPLLGVKGVSIISHGSSSPHAIKNAIVSCGARRGVAHERSHRAPARTRRSRERMKRPNVQISAIGRSVPARVMTNYDFAAIGIDTTHEWVMERTGISERHIAGPTRRRAAWVRPRRAIAMQRAGVQPGEIDIIICSTATPDRLLPATAVDIQAELGATRAAAFDISAACCGFLYGLVDGGGI